MFAHLIQDPPPNYVENAAPPPDIDTYGQMQKLASTFSNVDGLFYFTYAVCAFFFVLIAGVLAYTVVVHRRKTFDQPPASNVTHNTPLEVVWTIIPLIIVMVMFAWGYLGARDMSTVPADARWYKASAKQWNWTFSYPNNPSTSVGELWLEVDKSAAFVLESTDVLHAFYMPSMRVKRDVIPNRNQTIWFHPTQLGDFHLFCAEYCGNDHSKMYAKVHVVPAEEYAKKPWDTWDDANPAKGGESLFKSLCSSCHTLTGMPLVGPSWKGLFVKGPDGKVVGGPREVVVDGKKTTVTVDEAYITESIKKPDAKKAFGFEKVNMTAFPDLEEKKIKGIIEFMKTLAEGN